MKRTKTKWVISLIISGAALILFFMPTAGLFAVTAIDQSGGYIADRPSVLTQEVAPEMLGICIVIELVSLVFVIVSIYKIIRRSKPRTTTTT